MINDPEPDSSFLLMEDVSIFAYTVYLDTWKLKRTGKKKLQLLAAPSITTIDWASVFAGLLLSGGSAVVLSRWDVEPKIYISICVVLALITIGCLIMKYLECWCLLRLPSPILEIDLVSQTCLLYDSKFKFALDDVEAVLFVTDKRQSFYSGTNNVYWTNFFEVQLLVNSSNEITRHWLIAGQRAKSCFVQGEAIANFAGFEKKYFP